MKENQQKNAQKFEFGVPSHADKSIFDLYILKDSVRNFITARKWQKSDNGQVL